MKSAFPGTIHRHSARGLHAFEFRRIEQIDPDSQSPGAPARASALGGSREKGSIMGLEYFLRAIFADNDAEMHGVLEEFDETLETARELEQLAQEEPALATG